jgi:hypothetical protein
LACYPGPDPLNTDQDRYVIWKWAKEHGIDQGMSFHDVHNAINHYFYGGMAKPEWITEKLAGRKTPLRPFAMDAWKAQYNRRMMVEAAKGQTDAILKEQKQAPLFRGLGKLMDIPRKIAVWEHGIPLAITHPGDLAFQPGNMGLFYRKLFTTIKHAYPFASAKASARLDASVEQMLSKMKQNDLYDLALYSKLEVGERSRLGNLGPDKISSSSERAWSIIKTTRFELWEKLMNRAMKPGMSEEDKLALGKGLAEIANHATGAGDGWVAKVPGLFGPKLTASKISRMIVDPLKTANTFLNMKNATPVERYVAWQRLSRATQYLGVLAGSLGVNWGLNKAQGVKDEENVNWSDPTKADYLSFKTGGLEWSVPGLHTEIKFLANVLAIAFQQFHSQKQINKESRGFGQWGELRESLGQYALNKLAPGGQIIGEIATGHTSQGRPLPLPWVDQKGTTYSPGFGGIPGLHGWDEYASTHIPIPLTGPIKYVYDQFRANGASALDTISIIRGLTMAGMGSIGLHASPDYKAAKEEAKRQAAARAIMARH